MTKKATLLLASAVLLSAGVAKADDPIFRWVKSLDPTHTASAPFAAKGTGIATDKFMNVYVTGWFYNSLDLDPGPGNALKTGGATSSNGFIAKYDSTGTYIWGYAFGDALGSVEPTGLAVDSSGNVVFGGSYTGYIDFNPTQSGVAAFISRGAKDLFVVKFDTEGGFQWARGTGSAGEDMVEAVAVDSEDNVYITGSMEGTSLDFNERSPQTVLYTSLMKDAFVARYDGVGNYVWSNQIEGANNDRGRSMTVKNSVLYLTGSTGGAKFRFDATAIAGSGGSDMFVASYGAYDGALNWAHVYGGGQDEIGWSVDVDDSGYVYAGGSYSSPSFSFAAGNAAATQTKLNSSPDEDAFLLRLMPLGDFSWTCNITGNGRKFLYSVSVDDSGHIYGAGTFDNAVGMDQGFSTTGGRDLFAFKMNRRNQWVWTKTYGSSDEEERPVISAADDYSYNLTGGIGNTTRFGVDIDPVTSIDRGLAQVNNPSTTMVSNVFIAKFSQLSTGDTLKQSVAGAAQLAAIRVYPNPAAATPTVAQVPSFSTLAVYNLAGQCMLRAYNPAPVQPLNVDGLMPGYYLLEVQLKDGTRRGFPFHKQ